MELKDCLMDELGNNIFRDTQFKPKYRYGYFTDSSTEERKFFLEIELYGKWTLTPTIEIKETFFIIIINGKKEKKIDKKEYEFKNYIPSDNFNLKIQVENFRGIVEDEPKIEEQNGLYIFVFSLRKKEIEEEVISAEGDEDEDY